MGTGAGPDFGATSGKQSSEDKFKSPLFSQTGTISKKSVFEHREKFLGKSIKKIQKLLSKNGYESTIRKSTRSTSKAKVLIVTNESKERNIKQIQVSPGSGRHGNVPYVKISTTDIGKIKIIDAKLSEYKTDGKETAEIFFRRYK